MDFSRQEFAARIESRLTHGQGFYLSPDKDGSLIGFIRRQGISGDITTEDLRHYLINREYNVAYANAVLRNNVRARSIFR